MAHGREVCSDCEKLVDELAHVLDDMMGDEGGEPREGDDGRPAASSVRVYNRAYRALDGAAKMGVKDLDFTLTKRRKAQRKWRTEIKKANAEG